jgi:hypothetical protein
MLLREVATVDLRRVRGPHRVQGVQEILRRAPAGGEFRVLYDDDPTDAASLAAMFALLRESDFAYDVRRTPSGAHEILLHRRQVGPPAPSANAAGLQWHSGQGGEPVLQSQNGTLTTDAAVAFAQPETG